MDLQSAEAVERLFDEASSANLDAACRDGAVDRIGPPGILIATGDLHDNPLHYAEVVAAAGLAGEADQADGEPKHLTLHEIIHSDRLVAGVDLSYRTLARAADLKRRHPEHIHTLLANHELSQIVGAGIIKDGRNVVKSFDDGLEYVFGGSWEGVAEAIGRFIRSMPLALICECGGGSGGGDGGRVLCSHSLPSPWLFDRFDPDVLGRELSEEDYVPRRGSAHLMVWGRDHTPELLEELAGAWGVSMFVLGHEKADAGVLLRGPNAVILNSDHERGVYLPIDLADAPTWAESASRVVRLGQGGSE